MSRAAVKVPIEAFGDLMLTVGDAGTVVTSNPVVPKFSVAIFDEVAVAADVGSVNMSHVSLPVFCI